MITGLPDSAISRCISETWIEVAASRSPSRSRAELWTGITHNSAPVPRSRSSTYGCGIDWLSNGTVTEPPSTISNWESRQATCKRCPLLPRLCWGQME